MARFRWLVRASRIRIGISCCLIVEVCILALISIINPNERASTKGVPSECPHLIFVRDIPCFDVPWAVHDTSFPPFLSSPPLTLLRLESFNTEKKLCATKFGS